MQFKNLFVLVLAAATVGGSAFAHDDDGKVRDRQKPYRGPAWREADQKNANGGVAGGFDSNGIALKSWLPLNTLSAGASNANSCWGYIANGKEYAIIGLYDGTAFVDVTDPANAQLKAFVAGPASLWRDVRTHLNYCYAASEGGSGIQVIDMSQLATGTATLVNTITAPTTTTTATHTLAIDNASGFLYRAGGGSNGLRIYDLNSTPQSPVYVGQWSNVYIHEAQVKTFTNGPYAGKQIAFCCGGANGGNVNTGLYIVDVTNKSAPVQLGFVTYPGARYCHQGWLDRSDRYFYINDELDEGDTVSVTTTIVVDVQNLSAPSFVGSFNNGNPAVGHNLFVRGDLLYEANYRSGVRVFNLAANPLNPPEIAYFDTYPGSDSANFNGLWNIWPFYPSGTVIGSDIERGLFVWRLQPTSASFAVANPPEFVNPAGGSTVDVTIAPINGQTVNPSTAKMRVTVNGTTTTTNLASLGGNNYRGTFPAAPCTQTVSYQFEIANAAGDVTTDGTLRSAVAAAGQTVAVDHNFEAASGWTGGVAGDTATSGQWVRVDPVGTSAQPEDDHSTTGAVCWVTGQGAVGGAAGAADVDGGITTLLSPVFDMSQMDEPTIEYWYWYSNNLGGAPNADSMPVEISNNGGTTWTLIENIATNNGAWTKRAWRVRDFITPTASVRVRFVARDLATGSLVEAGVDDFRVVNTDCSSSIPGDIDGDGAVNAGDLAALLAEWGATSGPADINGDGSVDATDLAILVSNWTA